MASHVLCVSGHALHGDARNFNHHMVEEYEKSLHNFLDYQLVFSQTNIQLNREIEKSSIAFLECVRAYETASIENVDPLVACRSFAAEVELVFDAEGKIHFIHPIVDAAQDRHRTVLWHPDGMRSLMAARAAPP